MAAKTNDYKCGSLKMTQIILEFWRLEAQKQVHRARMQVSAQLSSSRASGRTCPSPFLASAGHLPSSAHGPHFQQ